jgi:hypothetical protein
MMLEAGLFEPVSDSLQFIVGIQAYEIKNQDDDSYDTKIEFLQKPG